MMSSHNDSFVASGSSPTYNFIVENQGTIFLLQQLPPAASCRIEENLPEDRMTFGSLVAVQHRFITDIVHGAQADGLVIR
jgi:hypothetical protein